MINQENNLIRALLISSAFILISCGTMNKTKDTNSVQDIRPDSAISTHESHPDKPSKNIVPSSFGEPPRYRGSINPINPAGPGASAY